MRISDWSSDVCSSDLVVLPALEAASGKTAGVDFGVGMNPEFLREGEAVSDFMQPDRIVLGGIDQRTIDAMDELYAPFAGVDRVRTGPSRSEERRVGKECVSTCRSRWAAYHSKKKKKKQA